MKIIISPSKTQLTPSSATPLHYIPKKHKTYFSPEQSTLTHEVVSALLLEDLSLIYKDKANDYETHYKNFDAHEQLYAVQSYTGLVFKQLNLQNYDKSDLDYLDQHLVILSALYGMTAPFDPIKAYRLDFQMKMKNLNLYTHWHDHILTSFKTSELIIDLASNEFSKMVDRPKITIHFRENHQGKLTNKATFAKMARGKMLHLMIKDHIKTIKALKAITFDGYVFNASMSDSNNFYFIRSVTS
ncbi:YaaA family protein [Fusibacter ferrireducens]|uniref:UPF0246 protein ISU02_07990 n=1 Tax=Fusibacter ferrireducens TaxID=2785058 RepID=A0ABR9ZRH2_9FIRM|nr:YaaA family protein [Fusibacter ferrireducens]MBF4693056.1 YaaA family protein [Fusibacter ferrireducens]